MIADLLIQTLDPALRSSAEKSLAEMEAHPGFLPAVLALCTLPPPTSLSAALLVKNAVNRRWASVNADDQNVIYS